MRHVNGSARGPGRLVSGGLAGRWLRPWFGGRLILAVTRRPIRLLSRRGAAGGLPAGGLFQRDLLLDGPLFSRGLLISLWLIGGRVPVRLLGRRVLVCRVLVCRAALSRLRAGPAGGRFSEPGLRGPGPGAFGLSGNLVRGLTLSRPGVSWPTPSKPGSGRRAARGSVAARRRRGCLPWPGRGGRLRGRSGGCGHRPGWRFRRYSLLLRTSGRPGRRSRCSLRLLVHGSGARPVGVASGSRPGSRGGLRAG